MVLCRLDDVLLERASVCIRVVIVEQRDGRTVSLVELNSLSPSRLVHRIEAVENVGCIGVIILVERKGCIAIIIVAE